MSKAPDIRRLIPSVDRVLTGAPDLIEVWGRRAVSASIRACMAHIRSGNFDGDPKTACEIPTLIDTVRQHLIDQDGAGLRPVINLSGVVLHTNLGRACLPEGAAEAARLAGAHPTNLEFDLMTGKRGNRDDHVEGLICELTGCEAATIVNNGAAAVVLLLTALAHGKSVPVSRGELVEIGGSFRMPEIMEVAGCTLVEVGATNRTRIADYTRAIDDNTALLMKVHTSNYKIEGFTESASASDLIDLAHSRALPCAFDLGSGCLVDYTALGLPAEPVASDYISKGADLITFSGDKLLGGPQCGIIAGRKAWLDKIRNHPLKRAMRPDAMIYAALADVLNLYRKPETLTETLPALRHMTRAVGDIEAQVERVLPKISACLTSTFNLSKVPCNSQIGSGSFPAESLRSFAISIRPKNKQDSELRRLSHALRQLPVPVISRLNDGDLLLDLRCLDDESQLLTQLSRLEDLMTC